MIKFPPILSMRLQKFKIFNICWTFAHAEKLEAQVSVDKKEHFHVSREEKV